MKRHALLAATLAASVLVAPAAWAAPGDTVDQPIPIMGSLPITVNVDTTAAASEPDDPVDEGCWGTTYTFNSFFAFDSGSQNALLRWTAADFNGSVAVYQQLDGGSLQFYGTTCGSGEVHLRHNDSYLIMVGTFPDCCDENGNYLPGSQGGHGVLQIEGAPPDLEASAPITRSVANNRTGVARLSGTVQCNVPADVYLFGTLRQRVKGTAAAVSSDFFVSVRCDDSGEAPWSVRLAPSSGAFTVGQAAVVMGMEAYGAYTSASTSYDLVVRLKSTRE